MKLKLLSMLFATALLQVEAETLQFTEYVSVHSSTPEYQTTQQRIPYEECYNEQIPINSTYDSGINNGGNVAGSIIGGAIGGVLGHQIGKGKGNDAATIGGAILGTIVGSNTLGRPNQVYTAPQPRYQTRRKCITKYREGPRERTFIGYKNVAYYKGKKIVKYSNEKLTSIPVTVTIDY
jgi:uncharacterized protein YcfJ